MNFENIGINEKIIAGLAIENITVPTNAQEQAIPLILQGKDVVLQSQTGSGKTLAYLLPIYQIQPEEIKKGTQVVVIVPTRELAMQVHHQVQSLSLNAGIALKSTVLFGNVNINSQIEKLREKPQVVIGTSDRILALIKKKKLDAHTVKTLIVDEADKLVDKQSIDGIKAVRKTFMRDTQLVFVSATFGMKNLEDIKVMAPNYNFVKTQTKYQIPPNIAHYYIECDKRDKLDTLRKLMFILKPTKGIAFINQLSEMYIATQKLNFHKLECAGIHSDSLKEERQKRLLDFSTGKLKLLLATDLASRGLHVEDVTCVFSVSTAEDPVDYLHRAGRTGRNDSEGMSICLISPVEMQFIERYESKFHIDIKKIRMRNGEIVIVNDDNSETLLSSHQKPSKNQ